MLSKNKAKYIKSLHEKKFRNQYLEFLVEGEKSLLELLNSDFEIIELFISQDFFDKYNNLLKNKSFEIINISEIVNISTLKTNDSGIALVKQKQNIELKNNSKEIILILDNIKDPGNFGTIIRTCDWYGITKIICSYDTVEFYNPKVIISTMGSFCRVNIFYTDLEKYLENNNTFSYGAFISGESIYQTNFQKGSFLIIGNESNGISNKLKKYIKKEITIPKIGNAESLNAGIATAIILDNIIRKIN